ncbi:PREDICTED: jouberin-like, partial [Amphimedon queenslandica]|uniref:Uncharacterized protein n=1 Tax=Amphimedon queenslandica TaxID=400682 RepID=A0A1X7SQT7_AMPQE
MRAVIKDSTELTNPDGRVLRSTSPLVPESSSEGLTKLRSSRLKGVLHESINSLDDGLNADPQWTRLPGQPCAVPSKLDQYLLTGSNGCSALSFSHSGRFLAAGIEDNGQSMIKIYQVMKWVLLCTLPSDTNIIYKLSWSIDDNQLACASASGLCHVWSFTEAGNVETLLPHPSYVYCCEWIGPPSKDWSGFIVTGCYDGAIRCWKQHQ